MAKGVDTNTIILLGGLGLLGFAMFYVMRQQPQQQVTPSAQSLASGVASAGGVSDPNTISMMAQLMQQALNNRDRGMDKDLIRAQIISQYADLGIRGAAAIISSIAGFF